jgi:hypothetical protein
MAARTIAESQTRLILESILNRMGGAWVAETSAQIIKSWAESGLVRDTQTIHRMESEASAFWAISEEIRSQGYVQR